MRRSAFLAVVLCLVAAFPSLEAWSNGGKSTSANLPKFGTHDYIAFWARRPESDPFAAQKVIHLRA
jgi:hypothetical protein